MSFPKPNTKDLIAEDIAGEYRSVLTGIVGPHSTSGGKALGISFVHLCNIENNRCLPSQDLIDRFRDLWGVDLYVLAWCRHGDATKLPLPLRKAANELAAGWQEHIEATVSKNRKPPGD